MVDAIIETLMKVSEFSLDQKAWLKELDINPLIVHELGVTALDVLLIGGKLNRLNFSNELNFIRF